MSEVHKPFAITKHKCLKMADSWEEITRKEQSIWQVLRTLYSKSEISFAHTRKHNSKINMNNFNIPKYINVNVVSGRSLNVRSPCEYVNDLHRKTRCFFNFLLSSCLVCAYVCVCVYLYASCSVDFTSLFMLANSLASLEAQFCTWWIWSHLVGQLLAS